MNLTVIIPTLNEEADLPRTLESVKFADQIIVVDSGSTDSTLEIARKFGATVVNHPFKAFSDTRNFADSQVSAGWILSIEADVVVPDKLATEIRQIISKNNEIEAYYIARINIIWGKDILHTDWGPQDDCHIRLYKKGSGEWLSAVHEQYITSAPTGILTNYLRHYNYTTVSEFIDKTNKYSELANNIYSPLLWLAPIKDFLKRYVYKKGILGGYHGLFLSYLQAVYHLNVLVKSWVKTSSQDE